MESQPDQLKQFAANGQPTPRDLLVLDLRRYWRAIAEGVPVPLFGPPAPAGVQITRTRHLRPAQVAHVVASPLSPEFYERAHGVPEIIVRDLRRRAAESGLPRP